MNQIGMRISLCLTPDKNRVGKRAWELAEELDIDL